MNIVMSCHVMLCYVMLCYVMLCCVMLCYVMLCYVRLFNDDDFFLKVHTLNVHAFSTCLYCTGRRLARIINTLIN